MSVRVSVEVKEPANLNVEFPLPAHDMFLLDLVSIWLVSPLLNFARPRVGKHTECAGC